VGCEPLAQRLLGGEGPVGNAETNAESLPINVRVEPFESGIPQSAPETGYTLSFDFASLEDLEQKLAPESATGNSQTSAFEIAGMTFAPNGDLLGLVSVPRDQVQRPEQVGVVVYEERLEAVPSDRPGPGARRSLRPFRGADSASDRPVPWWLQPERYAGLRPKEGRHQPLQHPCMRGSSLEGSCGEGGREASDSKVLPAFGEGRGPSGCEGILGTSGR